MEYFGTEGVSVSKYDPSWLEHRSCNLDVTPMSLQVTESRTVTLHARICNEKHTHTRNVVPERWLVADFEILSKKMNSITLSLLQ